jgi:two-component system response regulator YesN
VKALIIDDEKYTREGIIRKIDWNRLGITQVEEAEDGVQGIEKAAIVVPDLVICDINMPKKNGIECVYEILALLPSCKIIFLSGYSDKAYLKSAIRLRAMDYIEKPLDIRELTKVIEKTVHLIKQERGEQADPFDLIQKLGQGQCQLAEVQEKLPMLGHSFPVDGEYRVIAIKCYHTSEAASRIQPEQLELLWRERLHNFALHMITGYNEEGLLLIYLHLSKSFNHAYLCEQMIKAQESILHECNQWSHGSHGSHGLHITIGMGAKVSGLERLPNSEKSALLAAEQDFILGHDQLICNEGADGELNYGDMAEFPLFFSYIHQLKIEESISVLQSFEAKCRQHLPMDVVFIKKMFMNTALQLLQLAKQNGWIQHDNSKDSDKLNQFNNVQTLAEMIVLMENLVNNYVIHSGDNQTLLIRKVFSYINSHYLDNCSIDNVARSVGMNSAYLCVLFKKQTGMTVNQYMTKIKLERAQELLKDPTIKIYEIAQMAGYQDHNYFARIFRKLTGYSPSEYRERRIT